MANNDSFEEEDALYSQPLGTIQPYQFEPMSNAPRNAESSAEMGDDDDASHESGSDSEDQNTQNAQADVRTDNLAWCDCNNCMTMPTRTECVCCHEVGPVDEKIEEADITCITEHEGFVGNCLNRHVVETWLYEYVSSEGPIDDNEPINEMYRYMAYRNFTRWIWHHLGKGHRKVIPSCAVKKIREAYPSESYCGFKYARP